MGDVGRNERSEWHRLFGKRVWWQEREWQKGRGDDANVRIRCAIRTYGLSAYVKQLTKDKPEGFEVKAADNWHLKPLPAKTKVYFYSSPNPEVEKLAGPTLKRVEGVVANDPKFANHAVYQLLGQ